MAVATHRPQFDRAEDARSLVTKINGSLWLALRTSGEPTRVRTSIDRPPDLSLVTPPGYLATRRREARHLTNDRGILIIRDMPNVLEPAKSDTSTRAQLPDYELADTVLADTPEKVRALTEPTRTAILDLVLERAATVTELALALERPKASVAYHVDALVQAGLVRVVRTRRVRAIDERFYGRTGRTIVIGDTPLPSGAKPANFLSIAAGEVEIDTKIFASLRHARIPEAVAKEFFAKIAALAEEFTRIPRGGDTVFGFVGAVYPTDLPTLPESEKR